MSEHGSPGLGTGSLINAGNKPAELGGLTAPVHLLVPPPHQRAPKIGGFSLTGVLWLELKAAPGLVPSLGWSTLGQLDPGNGIAGTKGPS